MYCEVGFTSTHCMAKGAFQLLLLRLLRYLSSLADSSGDTLYVTSGSSVQFERPASMKGSGQAAKFPPLFTYLSEVGPMTLNVVISTEYL